MRSLLPMTALFLCLGCGGDDGGRAPIDAGRRDAGTADGGGADAALVDGGAATDAWVGSDAGSAGDAAVDAGAEVDAGTTPDAGTDAGGTDGGGTDGGCVPPPCPAPPPGCSYVGATMCTCGTLVCTGCGPGGTGCAATEFCDYPAGCAPSPGSPGMCLPRPTACPDVWDPVCGCDGMTHSNECDAHAAGTDVASVGECPDCRTSGCPAGETCEPCRSVGGVVYVCLPSGVAC